MHQAIYERLKKAVADGEIDAEVFRAENAKYDSSLDVSVDDQNQMWLRVESCVMEEGVGAVPLHPSVARRLARHLLAVTDLCDGV
jgi:hypothetical protein